MTALTRRQFLSAAAAAPCLGLAGCLPSGDDITLQGSGATFPAPLYKRWFLEYYKKHLDVRVSYQAIGSGAGVRQFTERLVNFARRQTVAHADDTEDAAERQLAQTGDADRVEQLPGRRPQRHGALRGAEAAAGMDRQRSAVHGRPAAQLAVLAAVNDQRGPGLLN